MEIFEFVEVGVDFPKKNIVKYELFYFQQFVGSKLGYYNKKC